MTSVRPSARDAAPRSARMRFEKAHLGREVLAAVRDVDRRHGEVADVDRDDPVLEVELRMRECGPLGPALLADVQADARVALRSVPVAPVALEVAEAHGQLIERGLDLLQADHVRLVALDPLEQLAVPGADAVDVPGGDLHVVATAAPAA